MAGTIFVGGGALLGLGLGYGVAYIGRLFNIFFFDAFLMGILGGAMLLLVGLALRVRPGKVLVAGCVVFALASWFGQRTGEYRFALRAHTRMAVMVVEEGGVEVDAETRKKVEQAATALFNNNVKQEAGRSGVWGYMEQQWRRGVLLLRMGAWSERIPLPLTAVLIGQVLVTLGTFLLAWMLVRRLQWLPACARCGLPLKLTTGGGSETADGAPTICPSCDAGD